ncbi:MAG: Isopentenyl-diphosphate delta-isomerase [bacterium ADurb.Bin400]|nr:MAG: Isopentenyl-diphosphate delta-isomerase [bacterium ADurb.Bin400]
MIEHPELARTYQIRRYAPDALIIGNIGIDYLVSSDFSINKLSHALKVAGVDAVYIHLNMVQELAQVEGCRDFTAAYSKIALMCEKIGVPVIAKEVGHGMDPITSKKLEDCGVAAIDIAGLGGTSWAYVESYRGSEIGETFRDWGIPTCLSLMLLADRTSLPVISSGGIENGIDITKSLVLGAKLAGIARLFLAKAVDGEDALSKQIENIISEIRCTMALIGVSSIADIHEVPYVVTGKTREMIDLLAKKY